MSKKRKRISLAVWLALILLTLAGVFLTDSAEQSESIRELMRDAVLHDGNQIDLFGLRVNPGLISAFTVTALLLTGALLIRIFVIPKFKYVPGKLQLLLEQLVGFFDGLGKTNSPHRHGFLNVYLFSAGVYIFSARCLSCSACRRRPPAARRFRCPRRCPTSTRPSRWAACRTSSSCRAALPATGYGASGKR